MRFSLLNNLSSIDGHWGIASKNGTARIKFSLAKKLTSPGKNVLVVDDVADTGDSFSVILDYLRQKNPMEIGTRFSIIKVLSTVVPDYWGEKLEEWNWIIYPWAFYEDMAGFIQELLDKPVTNEEIKKGLLKNFNITISRKDLLEMLNDFHKMRNIKKVKKQKGIMGKSRTLKG